MLHVIANAVITVMCLKDTYRVVTDPLGTLPEHQATYIPLGWVFAIHFYHMLAPGFKLYYIDWLHHILMVVVVSTSKGPSARYYDP